MSSPSSGKKTFSVAPVFHKSLKDLSTTQGECIVLECRVKGQPPPTITWKREGDVIEDCPDFRMLHAGEVATLVIGEVFPEDTGIFTCEATNKAGSSSTSCKLVVKGGRYHSISTKSAAASAAPTHPRPTQVLPAKQADRSVTSSSHVVKSSSCSTKVETQISHLTVTPKQPRYCVINSTVDSDVRTEKTEVVTSSIEIKRSLAPRTTSSSSSTPSLSNSKECLKSTLASNDNKASSSSDVAVMSSTTSTMATAVYNSPQTPSDENHNFKAEKDQLIQDVAKTIASPSPKQESQKKPSRELAIIERDIELRHAMTLSSPTSSHNLNVQANQQQGDYILYSPTLSAILEIEPQEYRVSTFEQRLMNEIAYRLERTPPVNEDPEDNIFEDVPEEQQSAPVFTCMLKNFKAIDGTSTKFQCKVTAEPRAKVYWFKDGKQISKRSQHYLQRSDGEGGHELYIPHLCMEDDGNYTALAANPQGRTSSTGRLAMVSERSVPVNNGITSPTAVRPRPSSKGELAADEESPVEKYYRPTFIQKPSTDTKANEGQLVRFDVKVTGLPIPDLEWLINGKPVRSDPLHKILVRENNVHSLLLERVSPMDEGQYTIIAKNKAGTATTHVQLHVIAREQTAAPAFIQRLSAQCVAEGDAVRLEARVIATPTPVICWKRGSDQVVHDHRTQLYQDDSGYVCLQITQAKASDAAWYTCSATNKAGISSCNCKLDVYSPTCNAPTNRRRIRTPHRYANLAKVAGVDMREALSPDAQTHQYLPESDEL